MSTQKKVKPFWNKRDLQRATGMGFRAVVAGIERGDIPRPISIPGATDKWPSNVIVPWLAEKGIVIDA